MKIRVLSVRFWLALLLPAFLLATACNKSSDNTTTEYIPVVKTNPIVANVSSSTADLSGYVTNYISNSITSYGICWSATNQTPTVADSKTTLTTLSSIYYGGALTGLTANTTYYARAYAVHNTGNYYGEVVQFKTLSATGSTRATISTFAGSSTPGFTNGTGAAAGFNSPQGLAADASGNLYVADAFNNAIRKITPAGVVTTLAGSNTPGYTDATGTAARFYSPAGLAVDASGNVYVADQGNNVIRKITAAGVVSTLAGSTIAGYADATTGSTARFNNPTGLTVDASGNVYVADKGNNVIRKVTAAGAVTTLAGLRAGGYADGEYNASGFRSPGSLALDGKGNLFVLDAGNTAIRKVVIADGSVTTYFGNPSQADLLGQAKFITIDAAGNMFITDAAGRLLEITAGNVMINLAGASGVSGFANGRGADAKFNGLQGVAVDAAGDIYVADMNNNQIRKGVINTVQ